GRRGGRPGDDPRPRAVGANSLHSRPHARAGRESVVDEHHRLPMEVERRPVAAVRELAATELLGLSFGYAVDQLVLEAQLANDGLLDHADAAAFDHTHRQLRMARTATIT